MSGNEILITTKKKDDENNRKQGEKRSENNNAKLLYEKSSYCVSSTDFSYFIFRIFFPENSELYFLMQVDK